MPSFPIGFTSTTSLFKKMLSLIPAGVVSLRNLRKVNLNAIAIERQSSVGGLWINHTPAYSSLQVLRADWALHGVSCGSNDVDDQRRFLRDDVCAWVEQYVFSQGIRDNIFLNREVAEVKPIGKEGMLFQVTICAVEKCGYLGGGRRIPESFVTVYATSVLVCAGIFPYFYSNEFQDWRTGLRFPNSKVSKPLHSL